jgi:hypothetical protein
MKSSHFNEIIYLQTSGAKQSACWHAEYQILKCFWNYKSKMSRGFTIRPVLVVTGGSASAAGPSLFSVPSSHCSWSSFWTTSSSWPSSTPQYGFKWSTCAFTGLHPFLLVWKAHHLIFSFVVYAPVTLNLTFGLLRVDHRQSPRVFIPLHFHSTLGSISVKSFDFHEYACMKNLWPIKI